MAHVGLWKRYQYVADSLKDLEEALAIGNHKGVEQNPKILKDLVTKDVTHGYGLVLPLNKLRRIPGTLYR